MTNRKIYTLDNTQLGIDLDKVLCFYISPVPTYHGNEAYLFLYIYIGGKMSAPNHPIQLIYSQGNLQDSMVIKEEVDTLYKDLIEYFKNE